MSATGRGAQRKTNDFYETPEWLTEAIFPHLQINAYSQVFEPACGKGAIVGALIKCGVGRQNILAADLNEAHSTHVSGKYGINTVTSNFLEQSFPFAQYTYTLPTLIITNPPYLEAENFVKQALSLVGTWGTVAMLLRLNFLGGQKRAQFLRTNPCDVYVSPKRPSFTGNGTDATEYAWFVWRPSAQTEFSSCLPSKCPSSNFLVPG